jgi:hypothetical protein
MCPNITDQSLVYLFQTCLFLSKIKLAKLGRISNTSLYAIGDNLNKSLTHLELYDLPRVSDESLCWIAQSCTLLNTLDLYRLSSCTDRSLNEFARLTNLTTLGLSEMKQITDHSLSELGKRCDIQSLTICHNDKITDRGMIELVRASPNLTFIDVCLVDRITLVTLIASAQCCLKLKQLVLSGNLNADRIPTWAALQIVKQMKSVQTVSVFQSQDMTVEDVEMIERELYPTLRCVYVKNCANISTEQAIAYSKTHRVQLITEA